MYFFDPSQLPAPTSGRGEKAFTLKNGQELTLAFHARGGGDVLWALDNKKRELWERYREGVQVGGPQTPPVMISENICWMIARLLLFQVRPDAAPPTWQPMLFEDWAVLLQRDHDTFLSISAFINELTPAPTAGTAFPEVPHGK